MSNWMPPEPQHYCVEWTMQPQTEAYLHACQHECFMDKFLLLLYPLLPPPSQYLTNQCLIVVSQKRKNTHTMSWPPDTYFGVELTGPIKCDMAKNLFSHEMNELNLSFTMPFDYSGLATKNRADGGSIFAHKCNWPVFQFIPPLHSVQRSRGAPGSMEL